MTQTPLPKYYRPRPYQVAAWQRRRSGKYTFYFKNWARQLGKDTDDIEYDLKQAWDNPGSQSVYIGLDNIWIRSNIFNKIIDGRKFWADYPEDLINVKDTQREVYMLNNPDDIAQAMIKFVGFLNDEAIIGSSYDRFTVSETSLYRDNAFQFIRPIWDRKLQEGKPLQVTFNGTPRGMSNVYYNLLRTYTGVDDPKLFSGEFTVDGVTCFVDRVRIQDAMIPDPLNPGKFKYLYTPEDIEKLKSRYLREFGNLNLYYQENECDFLTVNAGLVYQGIEQLRKDGRYHSFNLDTTKPLYVAFDIGSKAKTTDATSAVLYQYYNGQIFIYDLYEARGKALVECIHELAKRDYFHMIRVGVLPWDSDRSASSNSPIEEARQQFPNIYWHALEKERVDRGINEVRKRLPNMHINSNNCSWLMDCFEHYEYKRLEKQDDWAARPMHNVYSHMMDAVRYMVMGINEIEYFNLADNGMMKDVPMSYESWQGSISVPTNNVPRTYGKPKKENQNGTSYKSIW